MFGGYFTSSRFASYRPCVHNSLYRHLNLTTSTTASFFVLLTELSNCNVEKYPKCTNLFRCVLRTSLIRSTLALSMTDGCMTTMRPTSTLIC